MSASKGSCTKKKIVVVGAGSAGLTFVIGLKRQLNFHDVIIYEKAPSIGGTWRDNTYPGCGSDTYGHWYCLSTDLNPKFSGTRVSQPELLDYWETLVEKYDIGKHIVCNSEVISIAWDNDEQLYHVIVEDCITRARTTTDAHVVTSAIGFLNIPSFPKDLIAALPPLSSSRSLRRIRVFKSSTSAEVRLGSFPSDIEKWIFANVPLVLRLYRISVMLKFEMMWVAFAGKTNFIRSIVQKNCLRYMKSVVPAEYHDRLTPQYPIGCKRLVVDSPKDGYLAALRRPNMSINWDGITEITEDGVITKKGDHILFDVIVVATGYVTNVFPFLVHGRTGETLQDFYRAQGGPAAYLGTSTPGFPNFYILTGPNTITAHGSTVCMQEIQVNYSLRLVKPVLDGLVSSFEVTAEAFDAYNRKLQKPLSESVFSQCASWSRVDGNKKNFLSFPGPVALFWWRLRQPKWSHYRAVGPENWQRRSQRLKKILSLILVTSIVGVITIARTSIALASLDKLPKFLRELAQLHIFGRNSEAMS
ncbi:Baeyer-Villiger monooxygenase [Grifola frondosa]|uniref:Baeyer-Villiger monooxygenase n=1 Tax=Grifola frondosa TaxID=5627 RepID=A0A1C7MER2_GRIFR|nr:Baeyer-Villiger monooxygenase [Grifola frondosa]